MIVMMESLKLNNVYYQEIAKNTEAIVIPQYVDLGGLGVTCLPRDPRFEASNLAESMDFSGCENPDHKSFGRDFKLRVPSLRFQAR